LPFLATSERPEIVLLDMSLPVDCKRLLGAFPEPKQQ
jgi:hypothetical protein